MWMLDSKCFMQDCRAVTATVLFPSAHHFCKSSHSSYLFFSKGIYTSLNGINSSNKNTKNSDKIKGKQNQKISVRQLGVYSWNQPACETQEGTPCESPLSVTTIALRINWNHDCEGKEVAPSHFCSAMKYSVDPKLSWANFRVRAAKPCAGNTHQNIK